MAIKASAQITISKVIDIYACYRYYKLQSSTLTKPSKPTTNPPSGWSDTEPAYVSGSTNTLYFVDCNVYSDKSFSFSEVSKSSSYEAAKDAWNKADNAQNTANDAIKDVDVEYYLSTSATSLSGGSWSTTAPTWVNGKYMWSRTVTVDGAGNKTYSPNQNGVCIAGAKGDTGAKGDKGATGETGPQGPQGGTGPTGKGVSSIVEQYYKSTSATTLSGGSWSNTYPGWENGKYIWTRSIITYTDKNSTTTTPVCVTGTKGNTGAKGDTGSAGASLVTLITSYSYNQTEIDTYAKDGYSGSWYVTSTSGVKVNDTVLLRVRNTTKNGYCYIIAKVTEVESSTRVTATSQGVVDKGNTGAKGDKGETGPQGPQGVQGVKGADGKTYYTWIKYADSPTSGMSDNPSGKKYIGVAYNKTTATESTTYSDYSWSLIKGDKGDKGDKGETGGTGPTGPTGNGIKSIAYYYARTTSQTAPSAASITATSMPTLDATNKYLWQKEVITYTNNTSQTSVLLLAVYGNTGAKGDKGDTGPAGKGISSTEVTYQASTSGTSIPKGTWATSIPSVVAGSYLWTRTIITYTDKTSTTSYAVGKMGNTGATGKGIKSTSITYQAHSNGTTAPTGTWTDLVPATSAEKPYLWSRTILTYTDNTTSTTYSVGSTPDGVLDEIRKVLRYDNTKIVLGQDGEPTCLELTNEDLTVKSDSEDIISVTGENREVTSAYNPSGATFTRRYGKIINADGTIISCGNTVAENDYEIAEMVQYTGVDPLLSGHEAGIDITAKIAGVDSGTNKTETSKASINIHTIRNSRASVHSRIDSVADWIHFNGKQIKFYPTESFGIDGASIGITGKGIGLYPTEELELGIPVVTGNCNMLTKSCTWYLGNGSTNRPLDQNGWLISRSYSTDYCHQTYITNTGGIYRRMMQSGKWSIWQGGYANVKKLWSGTLSKGGSVAVANLSLFDTFILGTSSGTAMLIGTRYYDQNQNRGTTVLFTAGHDDGTTSYLYKATTSMSGTTFRLTSCSVHTLDPTGCGGHAATVKSLYGVM